MGIAANGGQWLEHVAGNPVLMRFVQKFTAANFNAPTVTCECPSFDTPGSIRTIVAERILVEIVGAGAGVHIDVAPYDASGAGTFADADMFTTTAATECRLIELNLPLPKTVKATWLSLHNMAGYAATDDLYIVVWGIIEYDSLEKVSEQYEPTPVSLEGYKWPLKRRF